ncbi:hypothetical protein, partial [Clostridioides difficile]|uniref:hypothetical protein n=1 Tax=Clostridioides difficile TaxID=1496 RepID=UPI001A9A52FD
PPRTTQRESASASEVDKRQRYAISVLIVLYSQHYQIHQIKLINYSTSNEIISINDTLFSKQII